MPVPLVLASQSISRRNVLNTAGVCPIIRVSHVDEPAALNVAASEAGKAVEDLSIEEQVMILARAKAQAVYEIYRSVAQTAMDATGQSVSAYPLQSHPSSVDMIRTDTLEPDALRSDTVLSNTVQSRTVLSQDAESENENARQQTRIPASRPEYDQSSTQTRDFSGRDIPTLTEPIAAAEARHHGIATSAVGPLIVGCDCMFLMNGEIYGKPHTEDVARERLKTMRANSGELWTGHCVIDVATGRSVCGSSHATVHFGMYSDNDIERYIATGEPLEVAGSFTLEGFGAAFIECIEGDPHGVMGISVPLLRSLVAQLGVQWTDLWNVGRGVPEPISKAQAERHLPPKENVHQPGDGWVHCACGRRHWGTNGAAGILLARRNEQTGDIADIVMQHRAVWSAEGGTWGVPGGAIADGESPIEGALRESFEEANIVSEDIEVVGSYREDHGPWAYTTVFAFEKPGHHVKPRANDDESLEIEWVPFEAVPDRKLLTALKTDWPNFAERLQNIAHSAK